MRQPFQFVSYLLVLVLAPSMAAAAPAPPGSVETTPLSPTAVRVYWSPPPGVVTGYRVLRDGQPVASLPLEARSFDDAGLEPAHTYRYQVVALAVEAPAPQAPPEGPTGSSASGASLSAPTLGTNDRSADCASPSDIVTGTSGPPPPTRTPTFVESPPSATVFERPEPEWPERLEADVLVVGSSSAGVGAAVAAARLGSRVVLLEETTRLGGMISNGLCSTDLRDVRRASGVFAEFLGRVRARYGAGDERRYEPHVANDELKAIAYGEPRLTLFTRVRVERVLMRDRRVIGVIARHLGTGRRAVFLASQTIDATPEGDVAAGAGCRYRVGRERRTRREPRAGVIYYHRAEDRRLPGSTGRGDRRQQSYAYLIVVKDYGASADRPWRFAVPAPPGYDPKNYEHTLEWPKTWAATSGRLPNDKYEINEHPQGSDLQGINDDYPEASPDRRAEIARRYRDHVLGFLHYLQTVRGLKNLGLADDEFRDTENFPPTLYVREARRIEGLVTLHEDDVAEARRRTQRRSIGIGDYPMDSHAVRPKTDWSTPDMGEGEFWLLKYTPWYQVPFGVMVPRDADGLLVPVAVSATHVGYGTLRMEPVRMALGQAAGAAAHFCAKLAVQPRELPARFLQDKLPAQGVALSYLADVTPDTRHYGAIQFLAAQGFFADAPFRPDAPTTRAEAAAWLTQLIRLERPEFRSRDRGTGIGEDAASQASDPASRLAAEGVMSAEEATSSDAPATRAQLARWLVRAKQFAGGSASSWTLGTPDRLTPTPNTQHPTPNVRYADVAPDQPDAPYIETLAAHRIDSRLWPDHPPYGEDGSLFHPEAPLSHADFAEALFLASRDISPLFAELPGPAVWAPAPQPPSVTGHP
jgi:hypothetical protein